jgi:hypothetical protein
MSRANLVLCAAAIPYLVSCANPETLAGQCLAGPIHPSPGCADVARPAPHQLCLVEVSGSSSSIVLTPNDLLINKAGPVVVIWHAGGGTYFDETQQPPDGPDLAAKHPGEFSGGAATDDPTGDAVFGGAHKKYFRISFLSPTPCVTYKYTLTVHGSDGIQGKKDPTINNSAGLID